MILGLFFNLFLIKEQQLFRESTTSNSFTNGMKTTLQILCVWTITLVIFPVLIMESFGGIPNLESGHILIGISIFMFFSGIGIYSAYTMVINGEGTPLPIDQTQKLVTVGPYKYIRNPMAVAGIGQALTISILLGSIPILVYSLIGAILWQWVVRPIEEKNMQQRFGEEYEVYRKKVRCWVPRFR